MKQSLQLRIGQSLTMTPQLQQAIKLLQLSSLELQAEIQETLDSNPLLEQEDGLGEDSTSQPSDKVSDNADSGDVTEIELQSVNETVADIRAEQVLPDELQIDASWDHIYDPPVSTGSSAS